MNKAETKSLPDMSSTSQFRESAALDLVRKNQAWETARRALLWTAGLPLFGFAAFVLYSIVFVFPLGPEAYGPGVNIGWPPRFAFFTYMLWVVTTGWHAIYCSRRVSTEANCKG